VIRPYAPARDAGDRLPAVMLSLVLGVLLLYDFSNSLAAEVKGWAREEYSYGYLSPVVAALMARQRLIATRPHPEGSWAGLTVILVAVTLQLVGDLTAVHLIVEYAFVLALYGTIMAVMGRRVALLLVWSLLFLALAIPLPDFLYVSLSTKMQLLSSSLGVDVLRLAGVSVFQEGNIIDLGGYKLQVAEACSGLRYLFPLVTFGYLAACLLDDRWWKRFTLLVSTAPITIAMNSLRIAAIGGTVDLWGVKMAEGLLHGFEGWVVFLFCVAILLAEMSILVRIGHRGRIRFDLVGFGHGPMLGAPVRVAGPMIAAIAILAVAAVGIGSGRLSERAEATPPRSSLALFPLRLDSWTGRTESLSEAELELLKLDDYALITYRSDDYPAPVNFYVAYYGSQRKGESAHSPQTCIPGGGWEITGMTQMAIPGFELGGQPLTVNRVTIQKGQARQLVYYWFQQRGRVMTNEYAVKWNIMIDALHRNRTDGALVRMVTPLSPIGTDAEADLRLQAMLGTVWGRIADYVPN
jgi:exosortase D (VPLPA-CTERM-specific)